MFSDPKKKYLCLGSAGLGGVLFCISAFVVTLIYELDRKAAWLQAVEETGYFVKYDPFRIREENGSIVVHLADHLEEIRFQKGPMWVATADSPARWFSPVPVDPIILLGLQMAAILLLLVTTQLVLRLSWLSGFMAVLVGTFVSILIIPAWWTIFLGECVSIVVFWLVARYVLRKRRAPTTDTIYTLY